MATLRLQAELEYWQREHKPDNPAERSAKRWKNEGQKLRRALRPVREADVYLGKLASLRDSLAPPLDYQPRCSRKCMKQIDELEDRLTRMRGTAAKKLVGEIDGGRERLERLSQDMETALAAQMVPAVNTATEAASALIAGLAAELPALSADNLHAFRKRVKQARYLAELSAPGDPMAARQAAALGRMQTAAGEWHDWKVLAQKARRALRDRSKRSGLIELLETLAGESLQKALVLCRRLTVRLLRHGEVHETSQGPVPLKLPVRRAEPVTVMGKRDCA